MAFAALGCGALALGPGAHAGVAMSALADAADDSSIAGEFDADDKPAAGAMAAIADDASSGSSDDVVGNGPAAEPGAAAAFLVGILGQALTRVKGRSAGG